MDKVGLSQRTLEQASVGFFQASKDGKLVVANQALARMLGYASVDELLSQVTDICSQFAFDYHCHTNMERIILGDSEAEKFQGFMKREDGSNLFARLNLWRVTGDDKAVTWINGVIEEISPEEFTDELKQHREIIMNSIGIIAEEFLETTDLESSIEKVIGNLGKATGANRMYLFQNMWGEDDKLRMKCQFVWSDSDLNSHGAVVQFSDVSFEDGGFIRWMEKLSQNEIIYGDVSEFPEIERSRLEPLGFKSIVVVPINVRLDWWGAMIFATIFKTRKWESDEIKAIKVTANVFGSAFHRRSMEQELKDSNKLFRTIADLTHAWEYWMAPDGTFIYSSPSFNQITGYKFEFLQHDVSIFNRIAHPDDVEMITKSINKHLATKELGFLEFRLIDRDGKTRWISHVSRPVFDDDGNYQGQRASNREITRQKEAEEKLQRVNEALNHYVKRLESVNKDVLKLNEMGGMLQSCLEQKEVYDVVEVYCKKLFPKQNGILYIFDDEKNLFEAVVTFGENISLAEEFASNDCWAIRMGQPFLGDHPRTNLQCQHVIEEGDADKRTKYLCVPLSTREKVLGLLCVNDLPSEESEELEQMAITVAERTALAIANLNLQEMLRMQTLLDPLTGLYNRRYLADVLDREMHRAKRQNSTFSVVMIDLDNFKDFNDQYGHNTGDEILQSLGNFLTKSIRTEDVACRYGGDEFILIMPGATAADAESRIKDLLKGIRELVFEHEDQVLKGLDASIGISNFPEHGATYEELLGTADKALYRAKDEGRNKIVIAEKAHR